MFSKFRTKRAVARQSRNGGKDDEPARPASQSGHTKVTGLHNNRSVDLLAELGSSSSSKLVQSTAPILPPIPRIASKSSQHGTVESTSPTSPTIRAVGTARTIAEEVTAEEDASEEMTEHLCQVRSIDQMKADLKADQLQMDSKLMSPPRLSVRSKPASADVESHTQTESGPRPNSPRSGHRRNSSRGSSTNSEIPSPFRLQEPEDYVTPTQAIQLGSQPQARPKSRLTKLNPLSYLSRRKTAQFSPVDEIDHAVIAKRASFAPTKPLSEDFDPRIKGKVVHDFTSPKPSHVVSVQDLRLAATGDAVELPGTGVYDFRRGSDSNLPKHILGDPSPERRHAPVFKEDFDSSAESWRLNPDDRRNQASTDIVNKVAALEKQGKDGKRKSALPAFAVHMPQDIPSSGEPYTTPQTSRSSPFVFQEPDAASTPNSIQQTPDSLKPPKETPRQESFNFSPQGSPLADRSRNGSPDVPQTFSSLPRHLRSKTASIRSQASRFSFDMAGGGSAAQEKLLEEKHRQRAAQRARATSLGSISVNEEFEGFDEDMDLDEGLEEEIPGMNDNEYNFGGQGVADMTLDARPADFEELTGLEDDNDDEFGTAGLGGGGLANMTLDDLRTQQTSPVELPPLGPEGKPQGLGLHTADLDKNTNLKPDSAGTLPTTSYPTSAGSNEPRSITVLQNRVEQGMNELGNDGFYFDDGEFDGEFGEDDLVSDANQFDESFLDEDFARGKHIENLKPLPVSHSAIDSSGPSTRPESTDSETLAGKRRSEATADTSRASMHIPQARRSSAYGQHEEVDANAALTQENLSAYHNALAFAANKAAQQGRFERTSFSECSQGPASPLEPQKQRNISFNETSMSLKRSPVPNQGTLGSPEPYERFSFDDGMDDDAIIDAANAEALENDDEDFYGSEFGFYASSHGSTDAQAFHGGWFGPAGMNQIKRSHSGREAFQEPNLTPITERSEWSNRNSMISLAMHGSGISPGGLASSGTLPMATPGLAQLADQMQHDGSPGDDMSLSALMKARRGAFGGNGSSTSLQSMNNPNSRSGSPSLYAFQQQQGVSPLGGAGIAPPPPLREEDEDIHSAQRNSGGSLKNPLLTLQTQNLSLRPTTSGSEGSPMKRATPSSGRPLGHSRTSSGAESVSYAIQKNDDGDEMWVVEKRRTLDNGEVEILKRDIVHGTL